MLNLYIGRACMDKDRFMYDIIKEQMKEKSGKILVIVPEQFTLQAERTAFSKLNVKGIMDIEILSFSRLAHRITEEAGGVTKTYINTNGKHMVLSKILLENNHSLEIFKDSFSKHAFIDMMNRHISEMKQFKIEPEDVLLSAEQLAETEILKRKLKDIYHIYCQFNEYLKDKYADDEDYINLLISKMSQSELINRSIIWIDGFDFYTPQTFSVIEKFLLSAKEVNMTFLLDESAKRDRDVFDISFQSISRMIDIAGRNDIPYQKIKIGDSYIKRKKNPLIHLEKELYAYPWNEYKGKDANEAAEITACSNYYTEAESVAAKIISFVRDRGFRFRDIAVICNDLEGRGSVVKRTFEEYGIPCFIDKKRSIMHNPFIGLVLSLLDVVLKGYQYEDVFRLLKTELTGIEPDEYEKLENYAIRYKIRGNRWKKDFVFGREELGEEKLKEINIIRKKVMDLIEDFEEKIANAQTVKEKTAELYFFLRDRYGMAHKIEEQTVYFKNAGEYEYAAETAQIWNVVISIFDQMVELIPDFKIDLLSYSCMLRAGFESVEVGVIPTTADQVIVGTIQRTRIGNIKALFIMGANDGVIPSAMKTEEILNDDEKTALLRKGIALCKNDGFRIMEEKLAIYRAFSKPEEFLWLSYAASDLDGKEIRPSMIVEKVRKILGNIEVKKDIVSAEDMPALISAKRSAFRHMIGYFRRAVEGENMPEEWQLVSNWFVSRPVFEQKITMIRKGLFYNGQPGYVKPEYIERIYQKSNVVSATRLETFSLCPFSHFIKYGLKAEERKSFEIAVAEIGDIFHRTLMAYSEKVGVRKTDWETVDRNRCMEIVGEIIDGIACDYKEKIFENSRRNKYRLARIKKAAGKTAWILTEHIQKGQFDEFNFETGFGRGKKYPPVVLELANGKTVLVEGRIDRVDVMRTDDDIYVKVIDYKSGRDYFNLSEIVNGLKLQLMLYLYAAVSGISTENEGKRVKPAGVFYFKIDDPFFEVDSLADENKAKEFVEREMKKHFKMKGLVLNDVNIIQNMDKNINGSSDIIPVSINKDGSIGKVSSVLPEKEFDRLMGHVNKMIINICESIMQGCIDIRPKKMDNRNTSCTYCGYKTICCFDPGFPGCSYEKADRIKPEDVVQKP